MRALALISLALGLTACATSLGEQRTVTGNLEVITPVDGWMTDDLAHVQIPVTTLASNTGKVRFFGVCLDVDNEKPLKVVIKRVPKKYKTKWTKVSCVNADANA